MQRNLISDEGAESIRHIYSGWLNKKAGGLSKYEAHLNIGMLAWRSGDLDHMHDHLVAAAKQMVDVIARRDLHNTGNVRQPCDAELPFMLVLIFGDQNLKKRLSQLPRQSWFQPEDEEYQPLANLLDVLRVYALDRSLEVQVIASILEQNQHPCAQYFYQPWIRAMCEGLLALSNGNSAGVQGAIHNLLNYHKEEALEGVWQFLVEGLMATWATVLYLFAKDAGMIVDIDSPYLFKTKG